MQILLFGLGILLFIGLVLIHEWGHYKAARSSGVDVEEFGLGLPPRAWSRKLESGMLLSLNWLPLGGFVKLKGEHDSDNRKGSFGAASLSAKVKIMLAGVFMNFVAGIILLTILAFIGMPQVIDNQFHVASDTKVVHQQLLVGGVVQGSPADSAGLSGADVIKAVSYQGQTVEVKTIEDLRSASKLFAGQTVSLTINHNGSQQSKELKLRTTEEVEASKDSGHPKGYLGITPTELKAYKATWSAPIVALGFTKQLVVLTIQGIGHALGGLGSTLAGTFTGNHQARVNGQTEATAEVGGPVAIGALLWGGVNLGFNFILLVIAVISLTLALMNVLPLPALDGGRLVMVLISRGLLRRPLNRKTEEWLVGSSMAILLLLISLVTIVDVKRFF